MGGGTPDTTVQEYWNGGIQWFTPSEIGKNKYIDKSERTITQDGLNNSSAKVLPINTILLSTRATIGESSIAKTECCTNQGFQSLIANEEITCYEYLYYLVATLKKELIRKSCGSTFLEISANEVRKIKTFIPSLEEQRKVASLLALLDERIATQIKIIEDLKKLKSAISNKLFARKDLLEKQITISEIGTLKNGYAFQSSTYNPAGSYKIITIANVSGERYIDIDSCNCIMRIPEDIQTHQVLKQDDILISLTGNVGRVSLCTEGNYLLNQRVGLLQLKPGVNREYIYQALSCRRYEQTMISCGQGAAQMNIGKGDVEDYTIPYSANSLNLEVVASTLKTYDLLISVEVDRLRLFMQQKQYLLAQMFI